MSRFLSLFLKLGGNGFPVRARQVLWNRVHSASCIVASSRGSFQVNSPEIERSIQAESFVVAAENLNSTSMAEILSKIDRDQLTLKISPEDFSSAMHIFFKKLRSTKVSIEEMERLIGIFEVYSSIYKELKGPINRELSYEMLNAIDCQGHVPLMYRMYNLIDSHGQKVYTKEYAMMVSAHKRNMYNLEAIEEWCKYPKFQPNPKDIEEVLHLCNEHLLAPEIILNIANIYLRYYPYINDSTVYNSVLLSCLKYRKRKTSITVAAEVFKIMLQNYQKNKPNELTIRILLALCCEHKISHELVPLVFDYLTSSKYGVKLDEAMAINILLAFKDCREVPMSLIYRKIDLDVRGKRKILILSLISTAIRRNDDEIVKNYIPLFLKKKLFQDYDITELLASFLKEKKEKKLASDMLASIIKSNVDISFNVIDKLLTTNEVTISDVSYAFELCGQNNFLNSQIICHLLNILKIHLTHDPNCFNTAQGFLDWASAVEICDTNILNVFIRICGLTGNKDKIFAICEEYFGENRIKPNIETMNAIRAFIDEENPSMRDLMIKIASDIKLNVIKTASIQKDIQKEGCVPYGSAIDISI